jgi:hypothetical protein
MHKHTKGPWNIHYAYPIDAAPIAVTMEDGTVFVNWTARIASGKTLIGYAEMRSGANGFPQVESLIEARANTFLMMAAPELLEALKRAYAWMERIDASHQTQGIPMGLEDEIVTTIAKAEGRHEA